MLRRLHLALLHAFQRLPRRVRLFLVRLGSPTFTVGTICVIERADGALLLIRNSYKEAWGFPGGLLKRGEGVVDGVHRETGEEIGVTIKLTGEPAVVVDPRPRRVDVVFRAVAVGDDDDVERFPRHTAEVIETRWFPPDSLPELQTEAAGALVALARQRVS